MRGSSRGISWGRSCCACGRARGFERTVTAEHARVIVTGRVNGLGRAGGRIGEAGDIAEAITFVVANRFVTGSVIECDGGLHVGAAAS